MPLPLSKSQAISAVTWIKTNFKDQLEEAVKDTPYSIDTLCGIACQETACVWLSWINNKTPDEILKLCVFDASGDFPDTNRGAFPKNTSAFRAVYGDALTEEFITEANNSRHARGYGNKEWVYKGYGIFQYDLQNIKTDEDFFVKKEWYSMAACLDKVMSLLKTKAAANGNDMFKTIKAYNGRGTAAENYANNVTIFISYSKEVVV